MLSLHVKSFDMKYTSQSKQLTDSTHDFGVEFTDSQNRIHKGVLKIDATCSNAEVRYPVDVDIIHDGCKTINPLGSPKKEPKTPEEQSKMAQAVGDRNEIEATFGTGKRVYRADNIRAKLPETAASWIGSCYFVKNVMKFLRELCLALSEIWLILKNLFTPGTFVCRPLSVMN